MAAGRIRIVFLITSLDVGGAEMQLARLVARIDRERFFPIVVSMIPPGIVGREINAAGVAVHSLGMTRGRGSVSALTRLVRLLRRERPQVLVTFMYHANILGRIAGRLARVPSIVSSIRNIHFGGKWRERITRATNALSDNVVVNSRNAANRLERDGVVAPETLRVIPNGIDTEFFVAAKEHRAATREALGLADETFAWLAVGRVEAQKNYPLMIEAFSEAARARKNIVLLIAGDGPMRNQCEAFAQSLGIAAQVRFLGLRQDIADLIAAGDAFVMSSSWEGLPNALMEACAGGLPSVATNVGGVSELIESGVSGIIVPPADHKAMARAMEELMVLDASARAAMGARAAEHVQANYAVDRVTTEWQTLFERLAGAK